MNAEEKRVHEALVKKIAGMGYPPEFGELIAQSLRTEKMMRRMLGYLNNAHPRTAEEITDEMLAICDDRDRWVQKKKAEYYNEKYNELLYYGLEGYQSDTDIRHVYEETDDEGD
jgi:hypothetical protein